MTATVDNNVYFNGRFDSGGASAITPVSPVDNTRKLPSQVYSDGEVFPLEIENIAAGESELAFCSLSSGLIVRGVVIDTSARTGKLVGLPPYSPPLDRVSFTQSTCVCGVTIPAQLSVYLDEDGKFAFGSPIRKTVFFQTMTGAAGARTLTDLTDGEAVFILGIATLNAGDGGVFVYNESSNATADNFNIFEMTGSGVTGRLIRQRYEIAVNFFRDTLGVYADSSGDSRFKLHSLARGASGAETAWSGAKVKRGSDSAGDFTALELLDRDRQSAEKPFIRIKSYGNQNDVTELPVPVSLPPVASKSNLVPGQLARATDDERLWYHDVNRGLAEIILSDGAPRTFVANVQDIRNLTPDGYQDGEVAVVEGASFRGDGDNFSVYWSSGTSTADNGYDVFKPDYHTDGSPWTEAGRFLALAPNRGSKLADSDATPDVSGGVLFTCADVVPAAITDFDGMRNGKLIIVEPGLQDQVFAHSSSMNLPNDQNLTLKTTDTPIQFYKENGVVKSLESHVVNAGASLAENAGLVVDGVTDNRTALAAVFADTSIEELVLPDGELIIDYTTAPNYLIDRALTVSGRGKRRSKIVLNYTGTAQSGGGNVFRVSAPNITFKDLTIEYRWNGERHPSWFMITFVWGDGAHNFRRERVEILGDVNSSSPIYYFNLDGGASDFNTSTDVLTIPSHELFSGSPVGVNAVDTGKNGLVTNISYYANVVDANSIKLYDTFDNAVAGTATGLVDITGTDSLRLWKRPDVNVICVSWAGSGSAIGFHEIECEYYDVKWPTLVSNTSTFDAKNVYYTNNHYHRIGAVSILFNIPSGSLDGAWCVGNRFGDHYDCMGFGHATTTVGARTKSVFWLCNEKYGIGDEMFHGEEGISHVTWAFNIGVWTDVPRGVAQAFFLTSNDVDTQTTDKTAAHDINLINNDFSYEGPATSSYPAIQFSKKAVDHDDFDGLTIQGNRIKGFPWVMDIPADPNRSNVVDGNIAIDATTGIVTDVITDNYRNYFVNVGTDYTFSTDERSVVTSSGTAPMYRITDTAGGSSSYRLYSKIPGGIGNTNVYRSRLIAKMGSIQWIYLQMVVGGTTHSLRVDLASGLVEGAPSNLDSYSVTSLDNGRYQIEMNWTADNTQLAGVPQFRIYMSTVSSTTRTGTGTDSFLIQHASLVDMAAPGTELLSQPLDFSVAETGSGSSVDGWTSDKVTEAAESVVIT